MKKIVYILLIMLVGSFGAFAQTLIKKEIGSKNESGSKNENSRKKDRKGKIRSDA